MIKIGVTGGIGSGKSFVCQRLEALGIPVYGCDEAAQRIMREDASVVEALKKLVGNQVYHADGTLNKAEMAAYLFANAEHARLVSQIVHPAVEADFLRFAETCHPRFRGCVMESAILIESGLDRIVDKKVLVTAPLSVRLTRVQKRDGLSEEEIRRRIQRQMGEEERLAYPFDFVLENDGTRDLDSQITRMLEGFKFF